MEVIHNQSKLQRRYDKINRLIEEETFLDGSGAIRQPASLLKYTYTDGGEVLSIKDRVNQELVGYTYDDLFYPQTITSNNQIIQTVFDSLGRMASMRYPNGITTNYSYDNQDRLEEIDGEEALLREYSYDALSNINQIKTNRGQYSYTYDPNSALITALYQGSSLVQDESFVWDGSGNRLNGRKEPETYRARKRPLLINNGLFEDATAFKIEGPGGQELERLGKYAFIYDLQGNTIKKYNNETGEYYEFEYDGDGRMVESRHYENDALYSTMKSSYDGLGRRIEIVETEQGSSKRTSYIYDGNNILQEYDTTNVTIKNKTYIGTRRIDDNLFFIDHIKNQLSFYHKDHLGSISAITDKDGNIEQRMFYSAFGEITKIEDKNRNRLTINQAIDQPFYYTGRELDHTLGLYYYRARHYDPISLRFNQQDPIGLQAGDPNLYRYVFNNPVNRTDPTGLYDSYLQGVIQTSYERGEPRRIQNTVQPIATTLAVASAAPFVAAAAVNTALIFPIQTVEFGVGVSSGFIQGATGEEIRSPVNSPYEAAGELLGSYLGEKSRGLVCR